MASTCVLANAGVSAPRAQARSARTPRASCLRAQQQQRRVVSVRAATSETELEEIDPNTGLPVEVKAFMQVDAGTTMEAGGFTWAYRTAEANEDNKLPSRRPTLFVHGLGSSSYIWRNTMGYLAGDGYDCVAIDMLGHGDSDKPTSGFDYSEAAYIKALDAAVAELGLDEPFNIVVQGFILNQYAMLWAKRNADKINRMIILNTPVARDAKLRPELAAYANPIPFLRPKAGTKFAGDLFNAAGSPYAMAYADAQAFDGPYQKDQAASDAIPAVLSACDFKQLLADVDEEYATWKVPTLMLYGAKDPFIPINTVFDFLEYKRTNMRTITAEAKLGHAPQEDYPEAIHDILLNFLDGNDERDFKMKRVPKKEELTDEYMS